MKGVILGIEPDAAVVDISHAVSAQNIAEGSFLLLSAYRYFPPRAIHVGVIDPGVGTSRLPIALTTPRGIFVGPDNGLFAAVLSEQGLMTADGRLVPGATGVAISNPSVRLPQISATFHGRDIFAPAAAHLAHGMRIEELGSLLESIQVLPDTGPTRGADGMIHGKVVHIDHFGNAVSNIPASLLSADSVIVAAGHQIGTLAETYQAGSLVALTGSTGLVEIAVRDGSAAEHLGLRVGDEVWALGQ